MNLTPIADGLRKYLRTGLGMVGEIQTQGAGGSGGGSGITIGTTTITGGTDTRVLFDDGGKVGESAGLTYVKGTGTLIATAMSTVTLAATSVVGGNVTDSALTANRVTVAGTAGLLGDSGNLRWNVGGDGILRIGETGSAGALGIFNASSTRVGLVYTGGGTMNLFSDAGVTLNIMPGGNNTMVFVPTAGRGPDIAGGIATTDVAALTLTRTNNNAAVVRGVQIAFTDTTSGATFKPFQVLGGAAAATNLLSVSKAGLIDAPAYSVGGAAGVSFGPSVVTSLTVVNGIVTAAS